MHAIIGERTLDLVAARAVIERALELEADPLQYAIDRYNIGEAEAYERAAYFCGIAFSTVVPDQTNSDPGSVEIEGISEARSMRAMIFDREIVFIAPEFTRLVSLASHVVSRPYSVRHMCIVPPRALRKALLERHQTQLMEHARQNLARLWPNATAHLDLGKGYRLSFLLGGSLLLAGAILSPFWLQPILVPVLFAVLLLPAWFRIAAILDEPTWLKQEPITLLDDEDLPVYSVMIPLRNEAHMVAQLAAAMRRLDYPASKLDIKFVAEVSSAQTVAAVNTELYSPQFEIVVVPEGPPHTKPKALNYALPFVRGEHVVVYDAEDIPAPMQLRWAASMFAAEPRVGCVQAELTIENAGENWLTALFASEYSALFGIIMPSISKWKLPMPLGGTSNHFRVSVLRQIGGWDAFNVTEDADMGARLSRLHQETRTFFMATSEEAPITLHAWLGQRTRWMKGWMQTFLVHNRHPIQFLRDIGWRNFLAFQIHVGGVMLTPPLHTLFMLALIIRFCVSGTIFSAQFDIWIFLQLFILFAGNMSAAALSMLGAHRLGLKRFMRYQWLLPLYWGLIGVAVMRAGWELMSRPYFWQKTTHGKTRIRRTHSGGSDGPANEALGAAGDVEG